MTEVNATSPSLVLSARSALKRTAIYGVIVFTVVFFGSQRSRYDQKAHNAGRAISFQNIFKANISVKANVSSEQHISSFDIVIKLKSFLKLCVLNGNCTAFKVSSCLEYHWVNVFMIELADL